ncbi:MAG: hypothetical protein JWO68_3290 [Actinomycetia bacterium]|nr:hypothetical protein [Actinomycetes bacterium]
MAERAAVDEALGSIREALELDGYRLHAALEAGGLHLTIEAGPEACPDCLSPDAVLAGIASDALARRSIALSVTVSHA